MVAEWIIKQGPYICCLGKTHFSLEDTYRLKMKKQKNIFHENGNKKKPQSCGNSTCIRKKGLKKKRSYIARDKEGPSNSTSRYLSEETQNMK